MTTHLCHAHLLAALRCPRRAPRSPQPPAHSHAAGRAAGAAGPAVGGRGCQGNVALVGKEGEE